MKDDETKVVRIPFMITERMRQELYARGYSREDVDHMTPQEAWEKMTQLRALQLAEEGKPLKWWQWALLVLGFAVASTLFVAWLLYELIHTPHPFGG